MNAERSKTRHTAERCDEEGVHRFSQMGTDEEKRRSRGETREHGTRIASRLSSRRSATPRFALPSVWICENLWT